MEQTPLMPRLLDLLDRALADQKALIAELSDDERNTLGTPERWSIKDMVTHITFWKRNTVKRLAAAASGETPPNFDDFQRFNEENFEQCRKQAWPEVIAEADRAHADLLAAMRALPEAALSDPNRFAWQNGRSLLSSVVGNGYLHPQSHIAQAYVERGDLPRATRFQEMVTETVGQFGDQLTPRGVALYNLACFYATTGQTSQALNLLPEALRLQPDLVEWSKEDPDFASLRGLPAYQALYQA
jgi:tetratricopeptide (TPR) repeat protein